MGRYGVEHLANGYVSVYDRRSGLRGLFTPEGVYHCGDLRVWPFRPNG